MTTKHCSDCGKELSEEGYCVSCRTRLWLFGQKVANKEFKPEAFNKFWSEKRARKEEEREETKKNE